MIKDDDFFEWALTDEVCPECGDRDTVARRAGPNVVCLCNHCGNEWGYSGVDE